MKKILLISAMAVMLAACGSTNLQNPTSLPTLLEYSDEFRAKFADELDIICKEGEEQTPKTCLFVEDSIELRAAIRAAQGD